MDMPLCRLCHTQHSRRDPCRFKARAQPESPLNTNLPGCKECESKDHEILDLRAMVDKLQTQLGPSRPCGNGACSEVVVGKKKYCSDKCRVAGARARKKKKSPTSRGTNGE